MTALEIKLAGAAAVLFALLALVGTFAWHEREVGEAKLQHSVEQANLDAQRKAAADTAILQAKAAQADQEARNAQSKLDAFVAANPLPAVRVCVAQGSVRPGVPHAAAATSQTEGAGPGPVTGSQVPAGSPSQGPDISPELDVIVRSFGVLAIDKREFQQRPQGVSP